MNEQQATDPQQTSSQAPQQGSQGLVMDVQPPVVPQPPASEAAAPATQPLPVPGTVPVTASPEAEESVPESEQTGGNSEDIETVVSDESDENSHPLLEAKATTASSRFRPAVVIAVLVGLALCGMTVYAYLQSNKLSTGNESHQTSEAPEHKVDNTAIQDIETAQTEVEEVIGTNIDSDFPESELTDEVLGL